MKNTKRDSQTQVTPFIAKTYEILNNTELEGIISWSDDGNSFAIKNVRLFEEVVLPSYFKHNKVTSFMRQMNSYSFNKKKHNKAYKEYSHPYFKKNRPELLAEIKPVQADKPMTQTVTDNITANHTIPATETISPSDDKTLGVENNHIEEEALKF